MVLIVKAVCLLLACCRAAEASKSTEEREAQLTIFPPNKATNVNPDTHLVLTFPSAPKIGTSGQIRIYDSADKRLVDTLDLSIPTSPNPSGRAPQARPGSTTAPKPADPNDKTVYQVNMVGGVDFHFFPIIVRGNTA